MAYAETAARRRAWVRVGLMTFHFAHNYGAVLQCAALQEFLSEQGVDVQVIDYRPSPLRQGQAAIPNVFVTALGAFRTARERDDGMSSAIAVTARKAGSIVKGYLDTGFRQQRAVAYREYLARHFTLSREYLPLAELESEPPDVDALVVGSDQVWNPDITFGLDPSYFLTFASPSTRRIAYAVSLGRPHPQAYADKLARYGRGLDAVSLRDNEFREEVSLILGREVVWSLDPVFLPRREGLDNYAEECPRPESPYILLYLFPDRRARARIEGLIKHAQRDLGGSIVLDVSPTGADWARRAVRRRSLNPGQFLTALKGSSLVITNSFHATALSVVYQKPFVSALPSKASASRIAELLRRLGLEGRLLDLAEGAAWPETEVDFGSIAARLEALRLESRSFLRDALGLRGSWYAELGSGG
jgi:hypothetical protein